MADDKRKKRESEQQPPPAPIDKQALQEKILRGVKPSVGEMTGKWVVDLKSGGDGAVTLPTKYDEKTAEEYPDDMRNWVDKMFDDFERYMFEYNKTVPHADLEINSERPTFIRSQLPSTRYSSSQQVATFFQGHLYTRYWALLIKGEETEVKAYVMPVDFLIGFETRQGEFKAYFEMRAARSKKDTIVWHIDAVPVSFEGIASMSKALFSALVKATKGELKETERFRLTSPDIQNFSTDTSNFIQRQTLPPGTPAFKPPTAQPAEQLQRPVAAQPPALPPPPSMMHGMPQHNPALHSMPGVPQYQNPMPQQQNPMGQQPNYMPAPNAMQGMQQQGMPQQHQGMPQQQQGMPQQHQGMPQQQQGMPQQQQGMPQQQQGMPQQQQGMAPAQNPGVPPGGQAAHEQLILKLDENNRAIYSCCQQYSLALGAQMDALTKLGVAALHVQNMDMVMQVMRRTNALKSIREKVEAFFEEWNAVIGNK